MDIMFIVQVIILLGSIFIGIRFGGIAIGYAGGLGVILLGLGCGMFVDTKMIPWDVVLIIMAVIAAISAMQLAGGLDYMVKIAEKILRKNPKHINFFSTNSYLFSDHFGRYWTYCIFHDACNC